MNVIITIEDPNEVQTDLIRLIAIQDEMKAAKRDRDETERIAETIEQMKNIVSRDATGTGTDATGGK